VNNAVDYYQDTMKIGYKGLDGAPVITKPLLQGGIVSFLLHLLHHLAVADIYKGICLLPRHAMLRTCRRLVLWSLWSNQNDRCRLYLGHLWCHSAMLSAKPHLDDLCQAIEWFRYWST